MDEITSGISSLIKPVLDSGTSRQTLGSLLQSCDDQRVFSQGKAGHSSFISTINGKLNESSSRCEGLQLLRMFLPQCPQDILQSHASTWMQFCLRGASVPQTGNLSFSVLALLLKLSVGIPDLSRHVSSVVVANFADQINQGIPKQAYLKGLECLEQCMKEFNGPCGPHRKVIERFLLSVLDYSGSDWTNTVWQAARCIALLPQIGGGGVGGIQYKSAWFDQQLALCRTLHLVLNDLYSNLNELSFTTYKLEDIQPLNLPAIETNDPILRTQKLRMRYVALSMCLQAMLVTLYPVPRNVAVSVLLDMIVRCLGVDGKSIAVNQTSHSLALIAHLPHLHCATLKLLEAMIKFLATNLLPFAGLINKLVIQTLKWTNSTTRSYGTERPYKYLRLQAYEILKIWCGTARLGSQIEHVAPQLFELAMADFSSEKEIISLSALTPNRKGTRRHRGNVTSSNVPKDTVTLNHAANKEVCVASLQSMQAVLMSSAHKIQAGLHKSLQETVVDLLIKVTRNIAEAPIPYSESAPRLELYKVLLHMVLDSHTIFPPPTSVAVTLFSIGLHDPDTQVSMLCSMAVSAVEKIVHPANASLYLRPDPKELDSSVVVGRGDESGPDLRAIEGLSMVTHAGDTASSSSTVNNALDVTYQMDTQARNSGINTRRINHSPSSEVRQHYEQTLAVKSPESQKSKTVDNVDLTLSDDERSEMLCEIDLAEDSDDGRSNVSLCSQATVNTPVPEKFSSPKTVAHSSPRNVERKSPQAGKQSSPQTAKVNSPRALDVSQEDDGLQIVPLKVAENAKSPVKGIQESLLTSSSDLVDNDSMKITNTTENSICIIEQPSVSKEPGVTDTQNSMSDLPDKDNSSVTSSKRAAEETEEEDGKSVSDKKLKLSDTNATESFDDMEEERMLLSFVDVTREEAEDFDEDC